MLLVSLCCYADTDKKEKTVKTRLRSWQLPLSTLPADTVPIDTLMLHMPMRNPLNDYSISNVWNGNLISPVQSRLYFDRKDRIEDIFGRQYEPYLITGHNVRFYNTTVPYSKIAYKRSFVTYHEENEINFLFTANLMRNLNLGTEINYLTGTGRYSNQQGKIFNGSVWTCYNGDKYNLHATVTWNTLKNFENGGIRDTADLNSPLKPEDIPTRLRAMSGYKYISALLHHSYSVCRDIEVHDTLTVVNGLGEEERIDTVRIEYEPILTFTHTFDLNNSTRQYLENKSVGAQQKFYPDVFRNPDLTRDSSNVLTLRNTITVTFEEAFNRLLKFGANVYAVNECQRYIRNDGYDKGFWDRVQNFDPDIWLSGDGAAVYRIPDTIHTQQWFNNTFVGGSIYKNQGRWIRYGADGDVCLLGYKIGEFRVNGHVNAEIPLGKQYSMFINANAYVRSETPTYYQQHYISNHYIWHNQFKQMFRYYVGGELRVPTQWVKPAVGVHFENRQNYIYCDHDGMLRQSDEHIQVLAIDAKLDLTTPWICWDNRVTYQLSSNSRIPVPAITLYTNLYYHGYWFKGGAMEAQIGTDLRFHTRYHAPVLNPGTGQFQLQDDILIGNYPVLNVYGNFYVKLLHLKFFIQYTHLNHLFMSRDTNALITAGYPYNPDQLRAGLAFHFFK